MKLPARAATLFRLQAVLLIALAGSVHGQAPAPMESFADRVVNNRYGIEIKDGRLSGQGTDRKSVV